MIIERKIRQEFVGKIIDVHSHVGIHADMYKNIDYPCCQSIEGLYYRQLAGGVDVNVVFPFGSYPTNSFPYEIDNLRLMKEVYEYCGELADRFLPFICLDTVNQVDRQITAAKELAEKYPIYGIKINPVDRKAHVKTLASEGKAILEFAGELDIPMIFHSVPRGLDEYSTAEDVLEIAAQHPKLRFCLAHTIALYSDLLDNADLLDNVWVDTAAIKIQCDLIGELIKGGTIDPKKLIDVDLHDSHEVMRTLVEKYPDLIVWGSDSPAYTFRTRRQQGDGEFYDFSLPGRYEDEISALECLGEFDIQKVANENTLNFIFGRG